MKKDKDSEFTDFRNRILLVILGFVIVVMLLIIIFVKKFSFTGPINTKMKRKETFLVFVNNRKCSDCEEIKLYLDNLGVKYEIMYEDNDDAKAIFKKYDFVTDNDVSPAVLYMVDGKLFANLVNINSKNELYCFIKNYKLSDVQDNDAGSCSSNAEVEE